MSASSSAINTRGPMPRPCYQRRLHGLLRALVMRMHDVSRQVGADGEGGHVEGAETAPDLEEALEVAGVAAEVQAVTRRSQHGPRRPQTPVAVQGRALGPVLGRRADDPDA